MTLRQERGWTKWWKKWKNYIILFLCGFVWDSVLSLDTIFTARFTWMAAACTTAFITILSYFVIDKVFEGWRVRWLRVLTLALGSAIGAGLTTWLLSLFY